VEQIGATYFGCIVDIPRSPRSIAIDTAAQFSRAARLPQVCVIETESPASAADIAGACSPHALQLHSDLDTEGLASMRAAIPDTIELWLAVGVPPRDEGVSVPVDEVSGRIREAVEAGIARIVLDTATRAGTGGTGKSSDWKSGAEIVARSPLPIMLAGGITPENVGEAIRTVDPQAIDVSSGVEHSPGHKDPAKIAQLMMEFRRATTENGR
jgi:phosphoribosylanthranilate isomerase